CAARGRTQIPQQDSSVSDQMAQGLTCVSSQNGHPRDDPGSAGGLLHPFGSLLRSGPLAHPWTRGKGRAADPRTAARPPPARHCSARLDGSPGKTPRVRAPHSRGPEWSDDGFGDDEETVVPLLNAGDSFPTLTLTQPGGQSLILPAALAGNFGAVLF